MTEININPSLFGKPEELFNSDITEEKFFTIMEQYEARHNFYGPVATIEPHQGNGKASWETKFLTSFHDAISKGTGVLVVDSLTNVQQINQADIYKALEEEGNNQIRGHALEFMILDDIEAPCAYENLPTKADLWKAKRDKINQRKQKFSRR